VWLNFLLAPQFVRVCVGKRMSFSYWWCNKGVNRKMVNFLGGENGLCNGQKVADCEGLIRAAFAAT
jgi:hypothetical protein